MIMKLHPIFFEKVWGGDKITNKYKYNCSEQTGEAWGISAHKHGSSIIENGTYKGLTLRELYQSHRELFGNHPSEEFPILIKIIDANDDLSVQVHPNDDYAKEHENSFGKTECWHILDTEPDTEIVIGHKAKNLEEFKENFDNGKIETLLNRFPIKKEDTYCVYSGTIHAICKGTLLLEIQQSSDITYRLYDYNRPYNGEMRELHVDKALDVIHFPGSERNNEIPKNLFDFKIEEHCCVTKKVSDKYGDYIFIMEGNVEIDNMEFKAGAFIFVPANTEYFISGICELFTAHIAG